MGISKDCISSPIEAGPSLLESQKLSPQLSKALEYISDRLIRKNQHLTLVVTRFESQLSCFPPLVPSSPSISRSPSSFSFTKVQFPSLPSSPRSISSFGSSSKSTSSLNSSTSSPYSPSFPPSSPTCTVSPRNSSCGISLYSIDTLSSKHYHYLQETIAKASKKNYLGDGWLELSSPSAPDGPTADLIRRSLQQHEIVFTGEGLTLLSLDRVYTFKLALSAYSRTFVPTKASTLSRDEKLKERIIAKTRAVDELRLLVLLHKGRCISQSYLLRAYDHLSIAVPALRSVNEAYKACFHSDGVDMEASKPLISESPLLRTQSGKTLVPDASSQRLDMGPYLRAPQTPGGYEEVTPITRGEWDSLMWGRLNLATVEIC